MADSTCPGRSLHLGPSTSNHRGAGDSAGFFNKSTVGNMWIVEGKYVEI